AEPPSLTRARQRLFAAWLKSHPQARDQAGLVGLPLRYRGPRGLPFEAPHFTSEILAHEEGAATIHTTLDLRYQRLTERILRAYVREQQRLGMRNAASLLVDRSDMGVRAA